ncbi:hypothetical protein Zm00014a_012649 [Zea mays]|uniref:Uncharacterized protein n=1 Tax=Zea mays TaxID=4577 RepID=A0A3L6FZN9_MAIZE|nr:hypothetical protein Zm00014a_012649 [Zea mays]
MFSNMNICCQLIHFHSQIFV